MRPPLNPPARSNGALGTPRRSALQQLLVDNRASARRVELVRNSADESTLYLYDTIVGDELTAEWWGGVCPQQLVPQIKEITGGVLHLRINSPGGDVFAGQAIAQALRECKARVVAHVDGLAASAASVIMIAAAEIEIAEGAFIMIHESWTGVMGPKSELRLVADLLTQIDDSIASQYARRTGGEKAAMLALMEAETWLGAEAAVEQKFADRVATITKAEARWNLAAYAHAPANAAATAAAPLTGAQAAALEARIAALENGTRPAAKGGVLTDADAAVIDAETAAQAATAQAATEARKRRARLALAS